MESYLTIKNWNQFQQYKDRDPKWIKLHRDILNDYDFDQLTEVQQNHLMKIWLLVSKLDNKIPNDSIWIARQIGAKSKVDIKQLVTSGFIVVYDSVQECTKAYLETETEKRQRESARKRASQLSADWIPDSEDKEYCKEKRPDLNPELVAENFRDYYLSHGKPMVDWKRTWQRWVRNERGNNQKSSNGTGKPTVSPGTANREAGKEYFRRLSEGDGNPLG